MQLSIGEGVGDMGRSRRKRSVDVDQTRDQQHANNHNYQNNPSEETNPAAATATASNVAQPPPSGLTTYKHYLIM